MSAGVRRPLPPELERVHMVGIGGAGMSGIARILLDRGALVSGSDAKESRAVAALRARVIESAPARTFYRAPPSRRTPAEWWGHPMPPPSCSGRKRCCPSSGRRP